jgi:hypothetical protein
MSCHEKDEKEHGEWWTSYRIPTINHSYSLSLRRKILERWLFAINFMIMFRSIKHNTDFSMVALRTVPGCQPNVKLTAYQITLLIQCDYLPGHTQRVIVEVVSSQWSPVSSGVPQGTTSWNRPYQSLLSLHIFVQSLAEQKHGCERVDEL